jgi:hypothetical protein
MPVCCKKQQEKVPDQLKFIYSDKDTKLIEIHALAFLAHIILNSAGVISHIRTRLFYVALTVCSPVHCIIGLFLGD